MHPFVQAKWIIPEENLGVLLMDFLELYGKNFSTDRVGISLLDDGKYFDKVGFIGQSTIIFFVI